MNIFGKRRYENSIGRQAKQLLFVTLRGYFSDRWGRSTSVSPFAFRDDFGRSVAFCVNARRAWKT